jgi:hypothetical protein
MVEGRSPDAHMSWVHEIALDSAPDISVAPVD